MAVLLLNMAVAVRGYVAPSVQDAQPVAASSSYQGWKSVCLSNNLVHFQLLPDIGGRIYSIRTRRQEVPLGQLAIGWQVALGKWPRPGWELV